MGELFLVCRQMRHNECRALCGKPGVGGLVWDAWCGGPGVGGLM